MSKLSSLRAANRQTFKPPVQEWHYLKEGELFQRGDIYGEGRDPFVIGIRGTSIKPGTPCPHWMMCYKPRRLKTT